VTDSEATTPGASGTPTETSSYVQEHLDHPVDGCPLPCCRITFTDHRGAGNVWNWGRGQWETEQ
jgi:hypothetical protein